MAGVDSGSGAGPKQPDIETVHRDLAFANTYRMELIKFMLAIAAGLFAFTVTFRPTLNPADWKLALWVGWCGLALSLAGGMGQLAGWEHFYKSFRDFDFKGRHSEGVAARKRITAWRRAAMCLQIAGLAAGVSGVGAFAAVNIDHVKGDSCQGCTTAPSGTPKSATPASSQASSP